MITWVNHAKPICLVYNLGYKNYNYNPFLQTFYLREEPGGQTSLIIKQGGFDLLISWLFHEGLRRTRPEHYTATSS